MRIDLQAASPHSCTCILTVYKLWEPDKTGPATTPSRQDPTQEKPDICCKDENSIQHKSSKPNQIYHLFQADSRRIGNALSTGRLHSLIALNVKVKIVGECNLRRACYCTHKLLVMLIFLTQPSSFIGLHKCRCVKIICSPNSHVTQVENIPPQAGVKSTSLANNWELLALETRNL